VSRPSPQPEPVSLTIGQLAEHALRFGDRLAQAKAAVTNPPPWYPYGTLGNLVHLRELIPGDDISIEGLAGGLPIVDIGAADGDLAYLLSDLGLPAEIVDYGPTNYNGLAGARVLGAALGSRVPILEVDLDSQFELPSARYGLAVFLGILYHLKNPFYVLERLARSARHCLLSTRIAETTADRTLYFRHAPVAYLVAPFETNDDPTNFWIFSEAGLRRVLERTGWAVERLITVGALRDSDPSSPDRDERAYCLLRSIVLPDP
jgi:hypothetical protein